MFKKYATSMSVNICPSYKCPLSAYRIRGSVLPGAPASGRETDKVPRVRYLECRKGALKKQDELKCGRDRNGEASEERSRRKAQ